jgi:hypothetical protein
VPRRERSRSAAGVGDASRVSAVGGGRGGLGQHRGSAKRVELSDLVRSVREDREPIEHIASPRLDRPAEMVDAPANQRLGTVPVGFIRKRERPLGRARLPGGFPGPGEAAGAYLVVRGE